MAELTPQDYDAIREAVDIWSQEQDGDLMMADFETDQLIAAQSDARFRDHEQGFLRLSLLVKRYDMLRNGANAQSGDVAKIDAWMRDCFPNGMGPNFAYQYLLDPVPVPGTPPQSTGSG